MKWLMLLLAGIFEIMWAIAMKYSNGFTNIFPAIITIVTYILSSEKLTILQIISIIIILIGVIGLKLFAKQ